MNKKYEDLFEAFTFPNGVELKNRIMMAPMTNYSANNEGTVTEAEVAHYARRSQGVGAVITACANVTPDGQGFPGEFGSYRDELIPSLAKLATAIKNEGAKAILQIFHGGRMCPPELVPNGEPVSASSVAPLRNGKPANVAPRELTVAEVEEIIEAFGESTRRAIEAGFDGIEIHGANGYLIQQFFSPHSNQREDHFGGSIDKRMIFPLAIVDKIQHVVAEYATAPFIVGYRFSPEEVETPGITMGDTLQLVDVLADKSLDYLHVSLGDFWSKARRGADSSKTRVQLLLEKIDNRVPLIGVGSIYTADEAQKAMESGISLLALGRELIIDPDWVQKIEAGKESEIVTKLDLTKQKELTMPDPFWNRITNIPGWFPGVE